MRDCWVRLGCIVLVIVLMPGIVLLLGYSGMAALLWLIATTALSWAPTLLVLERMGQVRRLEQLREPTHRPAPPSRPSPTRPTHGRWPDDA